MSLTDEQKKLRREGIGGSEIGTLAGLNPYGSVLDVYRAKTEEGFDIEPNFNMERGTFYEPGTIAWYSHRTGAAVRQVGTIRHPSITRILCTPDGLATPPGGEEIDLSIKVPGDFAAEQWGPAGTDDVPPMYWAQVQWELIPLGVLYGIRRAHVAAPINGDLRIYTIQGDAEAQGQLAEIAQRFWRDHVEPRRPPPLDGSRSAAEFIKAKFPTASKPPLIATPDIESMALRLRELDMQSARLEEESSALEVRLREAAGEHEKLAGNGWHITLRSRKGRAVTNYKALVTEIGVPSELLQKHTNITKGSRPFCPSWNRKKEEE